MSVHPLLLAARARRAPAARPAATSSPAARRRRAERPRAPAAPPGSRPSRIRSRGDPDRRPRAGARCHRAAARRARRSQPARPSSPPPGRSRAAAAGRSGAARAGNLRPLRRRDGARTGLVPAVRRGRPGQPRRTRAGARRGDPRGRRRRWCSARPPPAMRRSARRPSKPQVVTAIVAQTPRCDEQPAGDHHAARRPLTNPVTKATLPRLRRKLPRIPTARDHARAGGARAGTGSLHHARLDRRRTPSSTATGGRRGSEQSTALVCCDTNAASTYNPYTYPASQLRRPEPRDRRRHLHRLDRAGGPGDRAEDGRGPADRPQVAAEALGARARHLHARA